MVKAPGKIRNKKHKKKKQSSRDKCMRTSNAQELQRSMCQDVAWQGGSAAANKLAEINFQGNQSTVQM